ncbi:hypothetical protein [Vibrio barjaei]|uniref:hypothetical protein n=1 Tax=Vibrio barjaei TaxID=1676683 RepID=UPI0022835D0E|nr:hypothetical protein [Vibrio barjaei]MCY9873000.1 hypothetical protein [Vibrio barjaei]
MDNDTLINVLGHQNAVLSSVEEFIQDLVDNNKKVEQVKISKQEVVACIEKGPRWLPKNNAFSALFASGECAAFSEGMSSLLGSAGFGSDLIVGFDAEGLAVHYYNAFEHEGQRYFIDAYGIFNDESLIKNRYTRPIVRTALITYEDGDEEQDALVEDYNNATINLLDQMDDPRLVKLPEDGCDYVCVRTGELLHYTDVYEAYLSKCAKHLFDTL